MKNRVLHGRIELERRTDVIHFLLLLHFSPFKYFQLKIDSVFFYFSLFSKSVLKGSIIFSLRNEMPHWFNFMTHKRKGFEERKENREIFLRFFLKVVLGVNVSFYSAVKKNYIYILFNYFKRKYLH